MGFPDSWKIKRTILLRLYSSGCWGKGHMLIVRLKSCVPGEYKGDIKKIVKGLIKEEILVSKKTKHGKSIYLNKEKIREIEGIVFS